MHEGYCKAEGYGHGDGPCGVLATYEVTTVTWSRIEGAWQVTEERMCAHCAWWLAQEVYGKDGDEALPGEDVFVVPQEGLDWNVREWWRAYVEQRAWKVGHTVAAWEASQRVSHMVRKAVPMAGWF